MFHDSPLASNACCRSSGVLGVLRLASSSLLSLILPSHSILSCVCELSVSFLLLLLDTSHTHLGHTLIGYGLILTQSHLQRPHSKSSHIPRSWNLGLPHTILGDTIRPATKSRYCTTWSELIYTTAFSTKQEAVMDVEEITGERGRGRERKIIYLF